MGAPHRTPAPELDIPHNIEGEALGVRADIHCTLPAGLHAAIEVERGARHIGTVSRDLEAGYDLVVCLVEEPKAVKAVQGAFEGDQRVHASLVRDFEKALMAILGT